MKEQLLVFYIIILIFFSVSFEAPCTERDYKQYFSECDTKGSTRTVTIYLASNCENVQTGQDTILSIYSTLPTYTIPCSTKCSSGEYVTYDVLKKETVCSKCPEDTFSQGGDFKISSNWNHETIKKNFVINCYSIDSMSFKKNEDCKQFNVLNDRSMMTSGELTGQQIKYFFEMIYFFNSKNNGRVIIKYKKDTVKEQGFNNGELRLFFDYEYLGGDSNSDFPIKTIYHDFGPGEHEVVIFYNYYKIKEKSLKLYIQSFEVIGLEDASYTCEKCIDSIAPVGSEQCITCKANYYFDKSQQECKECPKDQFSVFNSFNSNSCMKRKDCNEFDYQMTKTNQCINKKRTIELSMIKPSFCLSKNTNDVLAKEIECSNTESSNDATPNCSEGKGLISYHEFDISSGKIEDMFSLNIGWFSNGAKLFVGAYLTENNEKILKLNIKKISSFSSAKISIDIHLGNNEFLNIKRNQVIVKSYTNVNKSDNIEIFFEEINNTLEFSYQKVFASLSLDNPVSITKIELLGTELSSKKICVQCPLDSISLPNEESCSKCKNTEIPNDDQTKCVPCSNGISQIINKKIQCSNCPPFTSFNGNKCILNEILHQNEEKLKFNLAPMKEWLNKLCSDQSGILCYENAFIGPINSKTSNSTASHDIFFISLFEPKKIEIYDFAYDDITNSIKEGHIFALFSVNKPVLTNTDSTHDIFIDHNVTYQNTKTKKNIAKQIQNVYLLGKSINSLKKLGVVLEFDEGDTCLSDPSKKYKAYVYLKCEKYQISSPKIINTVDNGCTYIFEWSSPYLCKNCLVKEITNFERGTCKNNQRQIIFSSNDDCLIFNASSSNLLGYNMKYNEPLLNETNPVHQLIFGKGKGRDLNVVVVKDSESVTFPFEYIENRTYYEKCTFIDNIESSWKKYLLIIPAIYLITCILVILYWCKYKKIKNEYEKLRNSEISHSDISKDKGSANKKSSNNLEIMS